MYWNNPIVKARINVGEDPIVSSHHCGQHCLFYNPAEPVGNMVKFVSLQETCDLANHYLGQFNAVTDSGDLDKIANIVRINQFVHSLSHHGNIKPVLLHYTGSLPMPGGTGGSRIMAAERLPLIQHLSAFISTHIKYKDQFCHLEEITSLAQFARYCGADDTTEFYFRLTDNNALYGIDWYEAALDIVTVPGNNQCLQWLTAYVDQQPCDFKFTPNWFDQAINWTALGHQAAKS